MGLKDVAGVFSRFFIVGFFIPCFFALLVLWQLLTQQILPHDFKAYSQGGQVAILGGIALFLGLLLSGLHYTVLRLLEGYPLDYEPIEDPVLSGGDTRCRKMARRWVLIKFQGALRTIREWKTKHWEERYARLTMLKESPDPSDERTRAAQLLARFYPDNGQLLPTRFGNAVRSFEWHPRKRWGLDGITLWPRIELLLSDKEQELLSDARTDVAFSVNSAVGGIGVGAALIVDEAINSPIPWYFGWLYAIPFLFSYLMYRAAVGAAIRWGESVRASFDVHRLELYERLGVRKPASYIEEIAIAKAVNRCLLYAEPIPDSFRV